MNHADPMTTAALRSDRGDVAIVSWAREIAPPADLVGLVAAARRRGAPAFYWEKAEAGLAIAASGCAWRTTAAGAERFAAAAAALRGLRSAVAFESDCDWLRSPVLFAGFSFADRIADCEAWRGFEPARLVLPELCVVRRGDRAALVRSVAVDRERDVEALTRDLAAPTLPGCGPTGLRPAPRLVHRQPTPAAETWTAAVGDSIAAIRGGAFDKLVLARSCRVRGDRAYDLESVLRNLEAREVGCTIFSFPASAAGDADFVGATPETLASLEAGELRAFALAGTAPRGATAEHDRRLREALETSGKDRSEHEFVVRGLRDDLGDLVHSLTVDGAGVVALRRVQHLRTELRGRVAPHCGILDIAAALHPSPAVGGYPKRRSVSEIVRREGFERGWYAGPIGWTTLDGEGELAVGLRCGVVRGRDAWLFAGAGIVRNSDPRAELLETENKLQPMLAALGGNE
jgi:isochorismate synthase